MARSVLLSAKMQNNREHLQLVKQKKIFRVGYNIDMIPNSTRCSSTYLNNQLGSLLHICSSEVIDGTAIETDWAKGVKDGVDAITELNDKTVAEGTKEAVEEALEGNRRWNLMYLITSKFTVGGKTLKNPVESGDKTHKIKRLYQRWIFPRI